MLSQVCLWHVLSPACVHNLGMPRCVPVSQFPVDCSSCDFCVWSVAHWMHLALSLKAADKPLSSFGLFYQVVWEQRCCRKGALSQSRYRHMAASSGRRQKVRWLPGDLVGLYQPFHLPLGWLGCYFHSYFGCEVDKSFEDQKQQDRNRLTKSPRNQYFH